MISTMSRELNAGVRGPSFDAPLNLQPYAIWRYANQHIRAVWYLTIAL